MRGWTAQDVTRHQLKQAEARRPSKYRNIKKAVHGILFDSTKEANRYLELAILQAAGDICDLEVQPELELIASNGEIVGVYRADFSYWDHRAGRRITEDVKSKITRTAVYQLKKRLVRACHGIIITEV